jgi:hypothetical protein
MTIAKLGGALTLMFGGGDGLRRPRRASMIVGLICLLIGAFWVIGGISLAAR